MIYLWEKNSRVIYHTDINAAAELDGLTRAPDMVVTIPEWEVAEGLARVINGKIVLGKTEEEKAEEERQGEIAELKSQLEEIDRRSGASRHVRDVSVSAGVVLDAIRILLSRFAYDLNIELPENFGTGLTTAEQILGLTPGENKTPTEIEDFKVFKALLLIMHFDPAINPGLTEIRRAEQEAAPIRKQLAPLLGGAEEEQG